VLGGTCGDALIANPGWTAASGALPIHAFGAAEPMLGAGTAGMELAADVAGYPTAAPRPRRCRFAPRAEPSQRCW
jgi:hypothetical protein